MFIFGHYQPITNTMAKKATPTPKMTINRMLKTSRTFTTSDYEDFVTLCYERIEALKANELNILKAQRAELDGKIAKLEGVKK
jgi:hypothetical protein